MDEKIIICDCDHQDVDTEKAVFEEAGYPYRWHHCMTQEEVIRECQGARVFLNQYVRMDETMFRAIPTLKCIVRYGVGVDNVDLDDATRFGVQVCNVPDYGTNEVADQALALMMSLVRKTYLVNERVRQGVWDATRFGVQVCNVPDYGTNEVADQALALMMSLVRKTYLVNERVRQGVWDYRETIPVYRTTGSTVGIIGLGRIGRAFARRVRAMDCRVIAYDTAFGTPGYVPPDGVEMVDLDTVLRQSDVISIHCSLNETSRNLIGWEELTRMKLTAYLINVARGGIIDEAALDRALTEGVLAGAGLDVVKSERLEKDDPLLKHPNFLVSPHMAWYSEQSAVELNRKAAQEAVRFMNGEPVHYPVNHL